MGGAVIACNASLCSAADRQSTLEQWGRADVLRMAEATLEECLVSAREENCLLREEVVSVF